MAFLGAFYMGTGNCIPFLYILSSSQSFIPYECGERDCPGTIKGLLSQQLEGGCTAVA